MSFELLNLRKAHKSGQVTWWSYNHPTDTTLNINTNDYFNIEKDRFTVGDWLFCTAVNGGCVLHVDSSDPLVISPVNKF